jgi:hypothetical protein
MTKHTLRPPPDLQALVRKFGTYSAITLEAWAQYDRELEAWKTDLRAGVKDVEQPKGDA